MKLHGRKNTVHLNGTSIALSVDWSFSPPAIGYADWNGRCVQLCSSGNDRVRDGIFSETHETRNKNKKNTRGTKTVNEKQRPQPRNNSTKEDTCGTSIRLTPYLSDSGRCPFPDSHCLRKPQNSVPLLNPGEIQNEKATTRKQQILKTPIFGYLEISGAIDFTWTFTSNGAWLQVTSDRCWKVQNCWLIMLQMFSKTGRSLPVLNGIMTPPN